MNRRSPFAPGAVLGLVGLGTLLFVALLWMVGAGMVHGPLNDGGAHGAGKGLTGYAALVGLLEKQGWEVSLARTEAELAQPGLVILTPPQDAEGKAIDQLVQRRMAIGPTLVVTPKWLAVPLGGGGAQMPGAKSGWVTIAGAAPPEWKGFLDDVGVSLAPAEGSREWFAQDASSTLPDGKAVLSGHGEAIVPLVALRPEGRVLAGYISGTGRWPALDGMALNRPDAGAEPDPEVETAEGGSYPLVLVFEPDLLDNYGFAQRETAREALRLVEAAGAGGPRRVVFDLTLNGFARKPNLLTLAFTPPFLAATLCLLLAALLVGWRAFLRFGPTLAAAGPSLAFGKRQLVANAAGLVRRSRRLHLLGPPYAALVRERLVRALGLPHRADPAVREAAIDRALAHRSPGSESFSAAAARLRGAARPAETLSAAQALHQIERNLEK